MPARPYEVGITGGIGTGKSTVARVFALMGLPTYEADSRAKWLMANDHILINSIISAFGPEAYSPIGLNRTYLAAKVFTNEAKLQQLNRLVHPAVRRDYMAWCKEQDAPIVLKESALLFETGDNKRLNAVIVVSAPSELRIKRVLKRDGHRSEGDVRAIMSRQWEESRKLNDADHVIVNDGQQLIIPQVVSVLDKLNQSIR